MPSFRALTPSRSCNVETGRRSDLDLIISISQASLKSATPSAGEGTLLLCSQIADYESFPQLPLIKERISFRAPERKLEGDREGERERESEAFIPYLDCRAQLPIDNESNLATGPDSRRYRRAQYENGRYFGPVRQVPRLCLVRRQSAPLRELDASTQSEGEREIRAMDRFPFFASLPPPKVVVLGSPPEEVPRYRQLTCHQCLWDS